MRGSPAMLMYMHLVGVWVFERVIPHVLAVLRTTGIGRTVGVLRSCLGRGASWTLTGGLGAVRRLSVEDVGIVEGRH